MIRLDRKFLTDWLANVTSLLLLAVTGLAINGLIATNFGAAALGVFNLAFAFYIFGAQVATIGVQFSILKYASEFSGKPDLLPNIVGASLLVVGIVATVTVLVMLGFFYWFGSLLYTADVAWAVMLVLPGVWCFAVNKALLNTINALGENRVYAVFVGTRYLLLLASLLVLNWAGAHENSISVIFSITEALLSVPLLLVCRRRIPGLLPCGPREWIDKHIHFGLRSMFGGLAVEMNTRVDVIVLGLFVTNAQIGIYSFAALFAEGMMQFPVIARRLVDPMLARLKFDDKSKNLEMLLRRGRNLGGAFMIAMTLVAVSGYPWVARLLAGEDIARESWPVFVILVIGVCVHGSYATFAGIFSQRGMPTAQTKLNVIILGTNIILNLLLIPRFDIIGSACATTISFIAGTFYLRAMVRKHFCVRF